MYVGGAAKTYLQVVVPNWTCLLCVSFQRLTARLLYPSQLLPRLCGEDLMTAYSQGWACVKAVEKELGGHPPGWLGMETPDWKKIWDGPIQRCGLAAVAWLYSRLRGEGGSARLCLPGLFPRWAGIWTGGQEGSQCLSFQRKWKGKKAATSCL